MKYIVLSFDDARKDFYTYALPILKKYGLTASVNVISDFVGKNGLKGLRSGMGQCATWEELKDCASVGIEIANHTADHHNSPESVLACKAALDAHFGAAIRGFVSPGSYVCRQNAIPYLRLLQQGSIRYIRSGNQIRRDGYFYALLYVLAKLLRSPLLFRWHNQRFVMHVGQTYDIYPSIMCSADNTPQQILSFIDGMKHNDAAILMFHSIIPSDSPAWKADKWCNSTDFFDTLCRHLAESADTKVLTHASLHDILSAQGKPRTGAA